MSRCSKVYKGGELATFALGAGRLAYAGTAKAISLLPGITGAGAASARNTLKGVFRGGLYRDYRAYSYEQLLGKYGTDAAIKAAAGRTSPLFNGAGASLVAGAVVNDNQCGCE